MLPGDGLRNLRYRLGVTTRDVIDLSPKWPNKKVNRSFIFPPLGLQRHFEGLSDGPRLKLLGENLQAFFRRTPNELVVRLDGFRNFFGQTHLEKMTHFLEVRALRF